MREETEFELNGVRYRAGKLNAREQFHVMRRLGSVLGAFGDTAAAVMKSPKDVPLSSLEPVFKALGALSDEDTDYVLSRLLSVVQREQANGWARVQTAGGALMFDDIDNMPAMMQIAFNVLKWNLSDFFSERPLLATEVPYPEKTRTQRRASNGSRSRTAKAGS
jgi:hypothetical protein